SGVLLQRGAAPEDDRHHDGDAGDDLDRDEPHVRPDPDARRPGQPDRDLPPPRVRDRARRPPPGHGGRGVPRVLPGAGDLHHPPHAAHAARAGGVAVGGSVARTRRILKWTGNILLVVMLVWTLVPVYWMLAASVKKGKEIYRFR